MVQATIKSFLLVTWALVQVKDSGVNADTRSSTEGCVVRDINYPLGQPFSFTNGCFQYSCDCNRDGSWNCPLEKTQNICTQNRKDPTRKRKQRQGCKVKGRSYSLDRPFSFTDGCYKYNCVCKNDGSWDCPASKTKNICVEKTEKESFQETITEFAAEGCLVKDQHYELGTAFSFNDGCNQFNCQCFLDGSWNCPAKATVDICRNETKHTPRNSTVHLNIKGCVVKGQHYRLGHPFSFTDGCYKYHCDCQHDGGWECPATQTENICQQRKEKKVGQEFAWNFYSTTLVRIEGVEVTNCQVEGDQYPLGRTFYYSNRCFRYKCNCELDGSWDCPAKDAENICSGRNVEEYAVSRSLAVITEVRACYAKGRYYTLEHPFTIVDGCFRYNCQCNEDGSWECPSEEAEYTCQGSATIERQQQQHQFYSRSLIISGGTKVKFCITQGIRQTLGHQFSFSYGCFRYMCSCLTNGSWECPEERATFICRSAQTETSRKTYTWSMYIMLNQNVRSCVVNGAEYPLGRTFSFIENCFKFRCNCHSDGSWECPAKRTEYSCGPRQEEKTRMLYSTYRLGNIGTIVVTSAEDIRDCTVNNNRYELGRQFSFTEGCFQYNCMCYTNGSWECPASGSRYSCPLDKDTSVPPVSSKRVYVIYERNPESCVANNQRFTLGQRFSFVLDCYRYNCQCFVNGSWECPADRSEYVCRDERERVPTRPPTNGGNIGSIIVTSAVDIRDCTVNNNRYELGRQFSFTEGCFQYNCMCYTNGSWECPASGSRYSCPLDNDTSVPPGSSRRFYVIYETNPESCVANNQKFTLGQEFSFVLDCFRYNCQCFVNGSWECPADRSEYVCGNEREHVPTRPPTNDGNIGTIVVTSAVDIRDCTVNNNRYGLGSQFSFTEGCFQYDCMCYTNGSWECPASGSRYICPLDKDISVPPVSSRRFYVIYETNPESCVANNQKFTLGQEFSFVLDCFRYNCQCFVNGSWECPADRSEYVCGNEGEHVPTRPPTNDGNIGTIIVTSAVDIRDCTVNNNRYRLGRQFSFTEGCFQYNCMCYTNGSWECPASRSRYICPLDKDTSVPPVSSRRVYVIYETNPESCVANNQRFTLGQRFSFVLDCFRYNCQCFVNGSWECPADRSEYVCGNERERVPTGPPTNDGNIGTIVVTSAVNIRDCTVNNKRYRLGSQFSFTEGCFQYNCMCYTNGSWECPTSGSRYTCPLDKDTSVLPVSSRRVYVIYERNPESCVANNQRFTLGQRFSFVLDCFRYNCQCFVNGSWECPADRSEYVCRDERERVPTRPPTNGGNIGSIIVTSAVDIRDCTVNNNRYELGRQFSFTEGCFQYNCMCYTNGSWECPASGSRYSCPLDKDTSVPPGSSRRFYVIYERNPESCVANNQKFTLGQRFSFVLDCFRYNCQCFVNGSWECPADRSEYVCGNEREHVPTRPPTNDGNIGTIVVTSAVDIRDCTVNNKRYGLGSQFSFTEGCFQYNCMCYTNGSWECPASGSRYICPLDKDISVPPVSSRRDYVIYERNPESCVANNQRFTLGQRFSFVLDCFRYNCQCFVNGSWECPADRSEYVCGNEREQVPTRPPTNDGNIGTIIVTSAVDIRDCTVNNNRYRLGSQFSFTEGCFQYNCMCYTNGSWECPASRSRYICPLDKDTSVPPGSSRRFYVIYETNPESCVANNQKFTLGQRFSFVLDCFRYNCQCFVNGSWECPADRSEYVCGNEREHVPTRPPTNDGNIRTIVVTSAVDIRDCTVNNKRYGLGSQFSFTEGCFQYNCMCYTNGSWECPASGSRYICPLDKDISVPPVSSRRVYVIYERNPESCVANNQRFTLGQRFSFVLDCFRYNCQCFVNGSWECPADRSEYVCGNEREQVPTRPPTNDGNIGTIIVTSAVDIRDCTVNNNRYRLGSQFSFTEGCFQYNCMCYTNGSWECPASRSRYICPLDKDTSVPPVSSRRVYVIYETNPESCVANNQRFTLGQRFSFVLDCFRYNCQCFVNGSWECPADRSEYVCGNEREQVPTRPPTNDGNIGTIIVTSAVDIRDCTVNNNRYKLGSYFSFVEGCFQYNCKCYTNGSWECPASGSRYTCPLDKDTSVPPGSSRRFYVIYETNPESCVANNQKFTLGQEFSFVLDCFRYNCQCFVNGSWECPADRSEYVCGNEREQVPTRPPTNDGNIGTIIVTSAVDIRDCTVNNNRYKLGSYFSFVEGCFQYNCKCYTNGSWECPASGSRYTCPLDKDTSVLPVSSKRVYVIYETNPESCVANNQKFTLGQRFSFVLDCFRYNCQCFVNGSWECPADRSEYVCGNEREQVPTRPPTNDGNIGTIIVTSAVDIRDCTVNNNRYKLGSYFSFVEGCFQYNCKCYTNGSWECPASGSRYTCPLDKDTSVPPGSSRRFYVIYETNPESCVANNQKFTLGQEFSFVLDCFRYNCQCFVNGSWECPADRSEYVCGNEREQVPTRPPTNDGNIGTIIVTSAVDIRDCTVNNNRYKLGSYFSFVEGCFQYNCKCYTNGSWECPASGSRYTCPLDKDTSVLPVSSKRVYVIYETNPESCVANNQKFTLGQRFSFVLDCFRYNCQCFVNGSWECPADRSEYVCGNEREQVPTRPPTNDGNIGTIIVTSAVDIRDCTVNNNRYKLGSYFSFVEGCFQYNCKCYTNGSWECPASGSRYTCPLDKDTSVPPGSSRRFYVIYETNPESCVANNQKFTLGQEFSFVLDCFRYNCQCFVNGSWECPADRSEYVCGNEREQVPTRPPTNDGNIGTIIVTSAVDIRDCTVNNNRYKLGSYFSFVEGCFQYNCKCYTNGSWECPASGSRYTCPLDKDTSVLPVSSKRVYVIYETNPESCVANNQKFTLGQRFSFVLDCFRYNCQCFVNGSWECPADRSEYVCGNEREQVPTRPPTNDGNIGTIIVTSAVDIRDCTVNNNRYKLGSYFSFVEGCFQYNCKCYTNGSWECPASGSRYTCPLDKDTSVPPGSSRRFYVIYETNPESCVANNQKFTLGQEFSFVLDCFRYNCQCFVNGSWECPADRSEYVCGNEREQVPTRPPTNDGNIRTIIVTSALDIRDCTVNNNRYELGRKFSFAEGCFQYNCMCNTNGSWECPASGSRYTCPLDKDTSVLPVSSKRVYVIYETNPESCVANNQKFTLGQRFSFVLDCFRYNCQCFVNGSWECPADRSEYVCGNEREQVPTRPPTNDGNIGTIIVTSAVDIRDCTVNNNRYKLGSYFSFVEGCFQYNCKCYTNGSWECPASGSRYTCPLDKDTSVPPGSSRRFYVIYETNPESCVANNQKFTLGQEFSFVLDCFRYNCQCFVNGSWECPADRSEYVCGNEREQVPTRPPTNDGNIRTIIVTSALDIRDCTVNNNRYELGRKFSFAEGCFQYNCMCNTNGSWECPASGSRYTCPLDKDTSVLPVSSRRVYVIYETNPESCVANNQKFTLGQRFSFVLDCFRYNCQCFVNGSWECPADRSEYVCGNERKQVPTRPPTNDGNIGTIIVTSAVDIRDCTVNNNRYKLGSYFSFVEGCFQYNCKCYTNGSWECPASGSRYTCPLDKDTSVPPGSSRRFYVIYETNPESCVANNQKFTLGQEFSFVLDCFRYNCQCFVNGSWECPADRSEYVCGNEREQVPTRPPTNDGNIGTIIVTSAVDIRDCTVNNNRYKLGSYFSFVEGCFQYNCMCYTNGSWECPASRSRYTCPLDKDISVPPGSSRRFYVIYETNPESCVANNQRFTLGQRFSFVLDCFRYNCQCFVNGSWECPADRSEYVCGNERERVPTRPPTNNVFQQSVVLNIGQTLSWCSVNDHEYPLGEPFKFTDDCYRYVCHCFVNGSWECPEERTEYICSKTSTQEQMKSPSRFMYVEISDDPVSCMVRGTKYTLGRPFSFQRGCFKYNCNCNTDGSWECLSENIEHLCDSSGNLRTYSSTNRPKIFQRSIVMRTTASISYCSVNGNEFPLGEDFTFTDGCFRYHCECFRNGSWECPGEDAEYICGQQSTQHRKKASSINWYLIISDNMRHCEVHGKTYSLGQAFSFKLSCFEFNCFCNTDGSWECLAEGIEYVCDRYGHQRSHQSSRPQQVFQRSIVMRTTASISYCSVNGNEFPLGEDFTFTDGCFRYHCECFRNGSWECPGEDAEYICGQQSTQHRKKASSRSTVVVISNDPVSCMVKGTKYMLGRPFSFQYSCFEYKCNCNTDGSWECLSENIEYICDSSESHTRHDKVCQECTVNGKTFTSGKPFSFENGCLEFHCHCRCDGSYNCPADQTVSKCNICTNCTVDGMKYAGGIGFKRRKDCEAITCFCHCNGTYVCFPEQTIALPCNKDIAHSGTPISTTPIPYTLSGTLKPIKGPEKATVGGISQSYFSPTPPSLGTISPLYEESLTERDQVNVGIIEKTEIYDIGNEAGSSMAIQGARLIHSRNETLLRFGNGTFSAHKTNTRVVNDTTNKETHGISESESCQICHVYSKVHRGKTLFRFVEGCYEYLCNCYCDGSWTCPDNLSVNTCKKKKMSCVVDGRSYRLNTTFIKQIDSCREQTCICNPDGNYNCLPDSVVDVCRQTPTCHKCNARGKIIPSNSNFQLKEGCFKYKCQCNCDGSWNCPGETAVNLCEKSNTCIQCNAYGTTAAPNSNFELEKDCIRYQCRCNCNGSWNCPGESAVNICPTKCIKCYARDTIAEPDSDFILRQDCIKYKCRCNCDGSWNCPGEKAVNVCNIDERTGCRYCDVRGERKNGNSRFELKDGCHRYQCICNCDGGWNCPGETAVNECRSQCQQCNARGAVHEPNTRFSLQHKCIKYDCVCNCDGGWRCPTGVNTCNTDPQNGCHYCDVRGKQKRGHTRFELEENCHKYQCVCNCDGSWKCPAATAINICEKNKTVCVNCLVSGKSYQSNIQFTREVDCYRYQCFCNCDGGWNCPAKYAEYICGAETGSCQQCDVKGKIYAGKTEFQYEQNCYRYRCNCKCDGSWNCPAENAEYICGAETGSCQQCDVKGRIYAGKTEFQHEENCYRYRCNCKCDGSWNCPAENAEYICGAETGSCQQCDVKGKIYAGNTEFQREENCYRYRCNCKCDGSWNCPAENAENICGAETGSCQQCDVKGKIYAGKTEFQHEENCYRYRCNCKCDGSWNCPAENAEYICGAETGSCQQCDVKGKIYAGNTEFQREENCYRYRCNCKCDGSWNCPAENAENICGVETGSCQQCDVKGKIYAGNTEFQREENCYRYRCNCKCDGSWNCPAENAEYICGAETGSCQQCDVKGKIYAGNTEFQREENCYRYRCNCKCDGSWNCPAENAENICGAETVSCQQCDVKGKVYAGKTEFQREENCYRYRCNCKCDGSWNCPAENAEYICGAETGSCQQCDVMGKIYAGKTEFQREENCYRYRCNCKCDGSWNCPAENAEYICGAETGSCQQCDVKGKIYAGNTEFQREENCYRYRCNCKCDGSWNCPAENAENICGAETGSCQQCDVKGKIYAGKTEFQHEENCYRYRCNCKCDGSWNCPAENAEYICGAETGSCQQCDVKGKIYAGNTEFQREENCYRYRCNCKCDGSWNCPAENAEYICGAETGSCQQCDVKGKIYAGNTEFQREENCYRYRCNCKCDGSWNCPAENAEYICGDSSIIQSDRSCATCKVINEVYQGNSAFIINNFCYHHLCYCFCNGTWNCPRDKTINLCSFGRQSHCPGERTDCIANGVKYPPGISFYQQDNCEKHLCTCRCNGSMDCFQKTTMPNCTVTKSPQCKDCIKQGKLYRGNSMFNYQYGCFKHTCSCGCDGQIVCPSDKKVDICAANIEAPTQSPRCRECRVNNETYKGNTRFKYKRNCMLYQCTCSCNGKWQCPAETAVDTCNSQTQVTLAPINNTNCRSCFIKHQSYKGNTVFFLNNSCYRYRCKCSCDGSWECPTETAVDICHGLQGQSARQCTNCNVRGQLYKGGEEFDLLEACFKFKCSCDCDGKWKCPSQQPENVCTYEEPLPETCLQCEVKGKKYAGNQWFTYKQGCQRFQCKCRCNGNWHCPKHLTANVCSVAKDKVKSDGTCRSCVVRGNKYAGDSFFSFDRNCLRFRCSCNCDGTWNCLAGPATNICSRRRLIGFCKKCYIGEKVIEANSTFEYDFGCTRYQCKCFCDGKFFCPGDRTEPICGNDSLPTTNVDSTTPASVCENCTLNDKTFLGNSNFRYTLNCFLYECNCGCDGTWACPPERSINICAKSKLSDCNECIINGYHYRGNSQFKRQVNCFEYTCTCYCNGSWVCPAEKAQYTCENRCQTCLVDGYIYKGESSAVIQKGCKKMECFCSCNGSWSCKTLSDACPLSSLLASQGRCDSCSLHGKIYSGNTWFSRIEGCLEYNCKCNCNGHWTCKSDNIKNLCSNNTTTETPSSTTVLTKTYDAHYLGCKVNGSMYYTEHFSYIHKCVLYNCTCKNGKHSCPDEMSSKIC